MWYDSWYNAMQVASIKIYTLVLENLTMANSQCTHTLVAF